MRALNPPFPLLSPFNHDLRAIFSLARRRRPRARSPRLFFPRIIIIISFSACEQPAPVIAFKYMQMATCG